LAAGDVWAFGLGPNGSALAEHWDGLTWNIVPAPHRVGVNNGFRSGSAMSPSDVWALGSFTSGSGQGTPVARWDGVEWRNVPNGLEGDLYSIGARSADDIWAVGSWFPPRGPSSQTRILHWDGTAWGVVASPNHNRYQHELLGVVALSNGDTWAVGWYADRQGPKTLVLRACM